MKSSETQQKRQASRNLIVLLSSNLFLAFKITLQKMMAGKMMLTSNCGPLYYKKVREAFKKGRTEGRR